MNRPNLRRIILLLFIFSSSIAIATPELQERIFQYENCVKTKWLEGSDKATVLNECQPELADLLVLIPETQRNEVAAQVTANASTYMENNAN